MFEPSFVQDFHSIAVIALDMNIVKHNYSIGPAKIENRGQLLHSSLAESHIVKNEIELPRATIYKRLPLAHVVSRQSILLEV